MRIKILLMMVVVGVLLITQAVYADYSFLLTPIYTDRGAFNYEVGSTLLMLKAQLRKDAGSDFVTGFAPWLGHTAQGFEGNKVEIRSSQHLATGTSWNGACTPSGGTSAPSYSSAGVVNGYVDYTRNAFSPNGITVGVTPVDLYRLNFVIPDINANAGPSFVRFRNISLAENFVICNWASGVNRLTTQNNFDFTIVAAAAPTGFAGPAASTASTDKGNTVHVDFSALSNVIGANDLTPPIKYDVYRSTTSGFPPADANKVLTDVTPSTSFDYIGAAFVVNDGPNSGLPGGSPNNLSDGTTYYYRMAAKDSTFFGPNNLTPPIHKMIHDMQVSATPHDYTPPSAPTSLRVTRTDDQLLRFEWGRPASDADDLDVYLVFLKQDNSATAPAGPALVSAFDKRSNEPGDDYTVGTNYGGWDLVKKSAETFYQNAGLVNGAKYWVKVFARDKEGTTGGAHEQGNNYSPPAATSGAPGKAPSAVNNLVAGGAGSGKISVRWTNPLEDYYGGAKVLITADITKWGSAMSYTSDVDDPDNVKLATDKVVADPKPETEEVVVDNLGGTPLEDGKVYYVGIFSYNKTPDPATRSSEGKAYAGTWPGGGGGGSVTYNFTKAAAGLGLNSFAILHDLPLSATVVVEAGAPASVADINTVTEFVAALGGPANVATIGWLEGDRMVGYYVTPDGFTATEGAGLGPADTTNMTRARAYQISVLKNMSVTVSGR